MTTLTATDARKNFFELIKKTNDEHEIFRINHRSGGAVLISEQEYDSLNETLALLSTPGFREDFEQSRLQEQKSETLSYEEVFGEKQ
ncbi:MAG: type II toxin-antitoxin system Phd/YefM family antitoxin [Proteobacteria bacterium]|jgi:antitoxin YefM|nr:type II toxin-antitoxin system Phd/YefM family antitoxin [Pseudomonadota bacterium]